jgi:hypothetical protein
MASELTTPFAWYMKPPPAADMLQQVILGDQQCQYRMDIQHFGDQVSFLLQ